MYPPCFFLLQLVARTRTPQEILADFERLQREREERRLQQRTNPRVRTEREFFKSLLGFTYMSECVSVLSFEETNIIICL